MDDNLKALEGKLADTQMSCQAHAREMIHFQQQLDDLRNRVQALEAAAKLQARTNGDPRDLRQDLEDEPVLLREEPSKQTQPLTKVIIASEEYWKDASGNHWNCSRYDLKAAL